MTVPPLLNELELRRLQADVDDCPHGHDDCALIGQLLELIADQRQHIAELHEQLVEQRAAHHHWSAR